MRLLTAETHISQKSDGEYGMKYGIFHCPRISDTKAPQTAAAGKDELLLPQLPKLFDNSKQLPDEVEVAAEPAGSWGNLRGGRKDHMSLRKY